MIKIKRLIKSNLNENDLDEEGFIFNDDIQPHIPPGEYEGIYIKRSKTYPAHFHDGTQDKFNLTFKIIKAPYSGIELLRHYNSPDKTKGFSKRHSYVKEWIIACDGTRPKRKDRISSKALKDKVLLIEVKDCFMDQNKTSALKYSAVKTIKRLIRVIDSEEYAKYLSLLPSTY